MTHTGSESLSPTTADSAARVAVNDTANGRRVSDNDSSVFSEEGPSATVSERNAISTNAAGVEQIEGVDGSTHETTTNNISSSSSIKSRTLNAFTEIAEEEKSDFIRSSPDAELTIPDSAFSSLAISEPNQTNLLHVTPNNANATAVTVTANVNATGNSNGNAASSTAVDLLGTVPYYTNSTLLEQPTTFEPSSTAPSATASSLSPRVPPSPVLHPTAFSRGRPVPRPTVTTPTNATLPPSSSLGGFVSPSAPSVTTTPTFLLSSPATRCMNSANDINSRLDTQVEVRVYPCNNSAGPKKKFTTFTIKPEGVVIQGSNRNRPNGTPTASSSAAVDLGTEYATHIGRKLQRYELSDNRACQLLVTTHAKSFWVVPAPEAFSRHSGTCRLLGDRKHPPAPHVLQVGDFLRVGSVGVVVIETHDGITNCVLSEEKIQRIMKDTTATGGFLDLAETDGENSDDSLDGEAKTTRSHVGPDVPVGLSCDKPVCYMCFDEEDTEENPMITPCKCSGDTKFVHVECLRKWHTAEADNQICFLSSVDATCSVCKGTFKSDFKLRDGRQVKLFKSSLEAPYVSLLVATKHEMAQRLFNTRFQLSFNTLMKPDGRNANRPLLLGRSSGSDMVLDYRTVSARHAAIRFKNGEFIFTDAGSSNGSYLYLRRPLELSPSQAVQFRLGRSMISMKVVNKWNRRLLRAVRGQRSASNEAASDDNAADDRSIGSTDGDVRIAAADQTVTAIQRRTRDSVMAALPPPGLLSQSSSKHLDLLYALAYPKREVNKMNNSNASSRLERTTEFKEDDQGTEQQS